MEIFQMCDRHLILSAKVLDGSPTPDKADLISVFPPTDPRFCPIWFAIDCEINHQQVAFKNPSKTVNL